MPLEIIFTLFLCFLGATCRTLNSVEDCSTDQLEQIQDDHWQCFLSSAKEQGIVDAVIRYRFGTNSLKEEPKSICTDIHETVSKCSAIYKACYSEDVIRYIIGIQVHTLNNFVGGFCDFSSDYDFKKKNVLFYYYSGPPSNCTDAKDLSKFASDWTSCITSTAKRVAAMASEFDSALLCNEFQAFENICGALFNECYDESGVEFHKKMYRISHQTLLHFAQIILNESGFKSENLDRNNCKFLDLTNYKL